MNRDALLIETNRELDDIMINRCLRNHHLNDKTGL